VIGEVYLKLAYRLEQAARQAAEIDAFSAWAPSLAWQAAQSYVQAYLTREHGGPRQDLAETLAAVAGPQAGAAYAGLREQTAAKEHPDGKARAETAGEALAQLQELKEALGLRELEGLVLQAVVQEDFRAASASRQEQILFLLEEATRPKTHSILELKGLGKEIWQGLDIEKYLREEKDSWR
jgi:hypothetical protein